MPVASATIVASIPGHRLLVFLLQISLLVLVARLLGAAAARVKMPAVVGELLAGIALGPSLLGAATPSLSGWLFPRVAVQANLIDAVAQVGLVLLVGLTGIEIDTRFLRGKVAATVPVSLGGLVIPLGLGIGAGLLLPSRLVPAGVDRTTFALFLGVALAVSAIPVIAKILLDLRMIHREIGQLTLAAATVDDVCGWLLLGVVSAQATTGAHAGDIAKTIGWVAVTVVGAVVLGRVVGNAPLRWARHHGGTNGPLAVVFVTIFAAAAATQAMGLEAILGAFAVGTVLGAGRELRPAELAPLRTVVLGVLAPLFFATAGFRTDLRALLHPSTALVAVVVLLLAVVGKFVGAYAGARAGGLDHWTGLALGAGLNARGVVQIVVATVGVQLGVLTTAMYTTIVLVAIVTSIMAGPTLRWAIRRRDEVVEEAPRQPLAWGDSVPAGSSASTAG
ncbi:cation:proton antiporter [Pseudofrankia sp. BMG5.37]|uniref:cation:proton antiporter n=1 Tax=Pseudofrankia sp. BMG5.37 TaxID=3050035 RepID=UPI00289579E0|nr:cation:proton antiporter [Pseudofrankia sp. BMG5.37]MDT3442589.1 cation:proton antiporter [Pseudofrankia sp. BMG5.37]